MDPRNTTGLSWRDGKTPVSTRFQDPYYAVTDGAAEARHVFLAGNDLPRRLTPGFAIAELGFGTGLNLIVTRQLWEEGGILGRLHYTSFEAYPLAAPDILRALSRWPEFADMAQALSAATGSPRFSFGPVDVELVLGDARETLSAWQEAADAWYLDGFSPARNPELWDPALMREVAGHTHASGTFGTYTAAGHVRRALATAGFEVERVDGFGHKRHMTRGTLR